MQKNKTNKQENKQNYMLDYTGNLEKESNIVIAYGVPRIILIQ